MKRIITLFAGFVLGMAMLFAQDAIKYQLTPTGIINGTDKDYIVIDVNDSLSQKELFEKTQSYLAAKFVSPQDVISAFNENTITINWVSRIVFKVTIGKMPADVNYTTTFLFKDGRVRINDPHINTIITANSERNHIELIEGWTTVGIFTTKGKVRNPDVKNAVEENINAFLSDYVNYLTSMQGTEDDW